MVALTLRRHHRHRRQSFWHDASAVAGSQKGMHWSVPAAKPLPTHDGSMPILVILEYEQKQRGKRGDGGRAARFVHRAGQRRPNWRFPKGNRVMIVRSIAIPGALHGGRRDLRSNSSSNTRIRNAIRRRPRGSHARNSVGNANASTSPPWRNGSAMSGLSAVTRYAGTPVSLTTPLRAAVPSGRERGFQR